MSSNSAIYISASRRTDLPRFYHREFFEAYQRGEISYNGGYGRILRVSLKPEHVLGYIFWSKDFSQFIDSPLFKELIDNNNAIFHFTINDCPELEPNVISLRKRLDTLYRLCELVGAERVCWRYDPIVKYQLKNGPIKSNEEPFFKILPHITAAGIKRCYFSFLTMYPKIKKRQVRFFDFDVNEKKRICNSMVEAAAGAALTLYNCCNWDILSLVPAVKMAHCIDAELLEKTDRFGIHRKLKIRPTRQGCGCYESRDIGFYEPACPHGCFYCYANPLISYIKF